MIRNLIATLLICLSSFVNLAAQAHLPKAGPFEHFEGKSFFLMDSLIEIVPVGADVGRQEANRWDLDTICDAIGYVARWRVRNHGAVPIFIAGLRWAEPNFKPEGVGDTIFSGEEEEFAIHCFALDRERSFSFRKTPTGWIGIVGQPQLERSLEFGIVCSGYVQKCKTDTNGKCIEFIPGVPLQH